MYAVAVGLRMPQSPLTCRKCRVGPCREGDTWCQFCSCLQTLSDLSRQRFNLPSFRAFGEEQVFQVTRQVQATVTLDRQTQSHFTSLTDRLNNAQSRLKEVEGGRTLGVAAKSAARSVRSGHREHPKEEVPAEKKEDTREEGVDFGTPDSSVSPTPVRETKSPARRDTEGDRTERPRGSEPPPEPADPPRESAPDERRRSRSRNRGRRGGERHQSTYRGLYEPDRLFHHRAEIPQVTLGWTPRRRRGHDRR